MADFSDTGIWEYAKKHFGAIITKDRDIYLRVTLYGPPPESYMD